MIPDTRNTRRGLEIRTRYYVHPLTGHKITLIGAIHAAHDTFWSQTQSALESAANRGVVHYERVKPVPQDMVLTDEQKSKVEYLSTIGTGSRFLATITGLTYQSEGIDFASKSQWKNIDENIVNIVENIKVDTLREVSEAVKPMTELKAASLVKFGKVTMFAFKHLSLFTTLSSVLKFFKGEDMDLLTSRNQTAITAALGEAQDVTLFWGAAHLKGMNVLLRTAGYRQHSTSWTVAIPSSHKVPDRETLRARLKAEKAKKEAQENLVAA